LRFSLRRFIRVKNIPDFQQSIIINGTSAQILCALGAELQVPDFKFVKRNLMVRKFGNEWHEN
jgi:hypothetical protein